MACLGLARGADDSCTVQVATAQAAASAAALQALAPQQVDPPLPLLALRSVLTASAPRGGGGRPVRRSAGNVRGRSRHEPHQPNCCPAGSLA